MMTLQQVVETTGMSRRVIQEYEDYGLAERPTRAAYFCAKSPNV